MPDGEPGAEVLVPAFTDRGIDARWVVWDDPSVDWASADVVAVRSTWDYHRRCDSFLGWSRAVEKDAVLLNGSDVFAWNAHKAYLIELADDVNVVPTRLLDDATLVTGLQDAVDVWGTTVIKPCIGAGGVGVVVADNVEDWRLSGLTAAPWVVQPLVESVRTSGETSVFVLGGVAVSQIDKTRWGTRSGSTRCTAACRCRWTLGAEQAALAEDAVRAAATRLGADLAYARVDMMRWEGRWAVSELELIEPGLYLDVVPANAERFADLIAARR